ncbi:hypothetical protein Pelo_18167 [Pelomyxa schiedti]|nr:hypothetical protein Pelo_18167 [Pelomyxa schiedti]
MTHRISDSLTDPHTQPPPPSATTTTRIAIATCGSQFGALMAAALPRCGARSPARHVAANAALMLLWWRRFVLEPSRRFVLVLEQHHEDDDNYDDSDSDGDSDGLPCITLSFGVSPVTLGVTYGPRELMSCEGTEVHKWAAPDLCVALVTEGAISSLVLLAPPALRQVGCIASGLRGCSYAANGKWLVLLEPLLGVAVNSLTLKNMRCGTDSGVASAYSGVVPFPLRPADSVRDDIVMNPANADEALIMSVAPSGVSFVLVDVALSSSSHKLAVLCSTRCSIPVVVTVPVAITRKRTGEFVFIVTAQIFTPPYTCAYWVEASTGCSKLMTSKCTEVSQVSSSRFGLWFSSKDSSVFELWDCDNPGNPLRIVDYMYLNNSAQVVCGGGFLFALSGNKMTVIEGASGVVVLTVQTPFNIESQDWSADYPAKFELSLSKG